jgi:hypothetical protein
VDVHLLLGRAMVHEVGHLLLGTSRHAAHGLMRAVWSREDLRDGGERQWFFTRADAARMRAALHRRSLSGSRVAITASAAPETPRD